MLLQTQCLKKGKKVLSKFIEQYEKSPARQLPEKAYEGDLCKSLDNKPYVYFQQKWLLLDEAMKITFNIQQ